MVVRVGEPKHLGGRTAAPGFHVSDTIDWSCLSAQIKNHTKIVRIPTGVMKQVITPVTTTEHRRKKTYTPALSHSKPQEIDPS